jgi:hypothetical protein
MQAFATNRRSFAGRHPRRLASYAFIVLTAAGLGGTGVDGAGSGGGVAWAQDSSDVTVNTAPPELPDYDQPPIPGDGYVWTPGYWAWSDDDQDYYWVPGTWVAAPVIGYLWTPGYWYADSGLFVWYPGYWGPHVGFYGGINYGHGYGGRGYQGGYWQGSHLFYNRAASNIGSAPIGNVYTSPISSYGPSNRGSFNGAGGIQVQASPAELAAAREPHLPATGQQQQHEDLARTTPALHAGANRGVPPIAATAQPGQLSGAGAVGARRGGSATPPRGPATMQGDSAATQRDEAAPSSRFAPTVTRSIAAPGAPPPPRPVAPAQPPSAAQRPAPAAPHPSVPRPKEDHDHPRPT